MEPELNKQSVESTSRCDPNAKIVNLQSGDYRITCNAPRKLIAGTLVDYRFFLFPFFFILQPPENELQKIGERVPSEHELRVQRSLQRLNVPDWYKNSPAARDGFRLKRHSDASQHGGWRALGSKTTSLSSLSSSSNRQPTTGKYHSCCKTLLDERASIELENTLTSRRTNACHPPNRELLLAVVFTLLGDRSRGIPNVVADGTISLR